MKIGYVLKSYPRLSQTFIVNELLAHERAGASIEIVSLRPPRDELRHASIERVRAPVTYLPWEASDTQAFWSAAGQLVALQPQAWHALKDVLDEPAEEVLQGMRVACWALERGIDHLHAHFGNVAAAVARLAARMAGLPYSFTAHAIDIFHDKVDPVVLGRKLADAKQVVTVSEFNRRFLQQRYGEAACNVRRVYNGLDMSEFEFASPHDRPPMILAVGRLVEKKGFLDLVDACALLMRRGVNFRCLIVGDGPEEKALRAQIQLVGLAGRLDLAGVRSQEEVKRLIQASACIAAPCVVGRDGDMDGLPTVILEALALGTPCVSTDVTGIPEVLHDGATGLVVPQHMPERLADALERLLRDADLRVALAGQGRVLVEREFDIHRNTEIIRALLAGQKPASINV